jgi:Tfp pilus assembly protein PilV
MPGGELKKMLGSARIFGKYRKALTITEVVVASLLLLVAIVPILKALTGAHVSTAVIERRTRSLTLAQAKLDEIKARSIYNYTNSGASFAENNTSLDGSYLCNVADDSGDPLKTITVSVGYDLNGSSVLTADEIEVTLATYLARRWPD